MAHRNCIKVTRRALIFFDPYKPRLATQIRNISLARKMYCPSDKLKRLRFADTIGNDPENPKRPENEIKEVLEGTTRDGNSGQSSSIVVSEITKEIHFYRDENNDFKETTYIDMDAPYGPPLTILLPWVSPDEMILRKFIEEYGNRGFDVVTVKLNKTQILYPRKEGGAMRTVANFIDYLYGTHRYRPYIVHGLSVGAYVYGEMMAQLSEQFENYYTIVGNIKGCLWDSPIEFSIVSSIAGKALYPRNFLKRWLFEKAVARHLSGHQRDSVDCWERSRDYFCRQKCRVPNLFLVSEKDPLSNPGSIEAVRNLMEQNGIPTYQKTWQDTKHLEHFTKHYDEYMHGMNLFFSLANLFPDPTGKYHSYSSNSHLTSIRLRRKVRKVV